MSVTNHHKVIIFSAPSGAGKTSIVRQLLERIPNLHFSISATTRPVRGSEVDGKDYYFLSPEAFKAKIDGDEFLEWEEVYANRYYGTLKSELDRLWAMGSIVLFDVDVKGGIHIKKKLGDEALAIFVMPPSIEELRKRLEARGTDSPEDIATRIERATEEMTYAKYFDRIIVNNDLEAAVAEAEKVLKDFIDS